VVKAFPTVFENRPYTLGDQLLKDCPQVKERSVAGFGRRLTQIRRSRGMTQAELAQAVGVSERVIVYYEQDGAQPPGAMLADLAKKLRVTADELLGLKPVKNKTSPKTARLLKRLQRIELLPPADQRAVLKYLDALLASRGKTPSNGASRKR
jgi:transcriptional regulator with XRE-family HTH domain